MTQKFVCGVNFNKVMFFNLIASYILVCTTILISVVAFALETNNVKSTIFELIAVYALFVFLFYCSRRNLLRFLHPINICFIYLLLSFLLGAYGFEHGLILTRRNLEEYAHINNTGYSFSFLIICFSVMLIVGNSFIKGGNQRETKPVLVQYSTSVIVVVSIAYVAIDYIFFQGKVLAPIAFNIVALALVYKLSLSRSKYRVFGYCIIFLVLVALNPHDKRAAIFLLFPILYLEAKFNSLQIDFKSMVYFVLIMVGALAAILAMSIVRGYGGFNAANVFAALPFILEYIESDIFISAFFQNIEVTYVYFHYFNAMDYLISGKQELLYGMTYVKPLFLFVPREGFPFKPESMIHIYTTLRDPAFRAIGGSWPVVFFAELFWNFHVFSIVILVALIGLFVKIFKWLDKNRCRTTGCRNIFGLFFYQSLIVFVRGSGPDLFAFVLIVGGSMLFVSASILRAYRRSGKHEI